MEKVAILSGAAVFMFFILGAVSTRLENSTQKRSQTIPRPPVVTNDINVGGQFAAMKASANNEINNAMPASEQRAAFSHATGE